MKNWNFQGQMSSYKYVNIRGESVTLKWKRCIQKIFKYIYIYTCETVCKTNSISSMHSNLTLLFLLVVLMSFDCRIMYFSWCKLEPDPKWSKIDWVRHHFPRILALVVQFFKIKQVFSVPKLHRHPLRWSKHSHSGEAGYIFEGSRHHKGNVKHDEASQTVRYQGTHADIEGISLVELATWSMAFPGGKNTWFFWDQNLAAVLEHGDVRGPACKVSMTLWNFTALRDWTKQHTKAAEFSSQHTCCWWFQKSQNTQPPNMVF